VKKKICFLANPYSPHVRQWEEILINNGYEIVIYTAHKEKKKQLVSSNVNDIIPKYCGFLPLLFRYVCLGFFLRFFLIRSKFDYIHAHNTSGYGLVGLLSGKKFIVTTYGTEVFSVRKKCFLYRLLIRLVLEKAIKITSTSPMMTEFLIDFLSISASKIHEFSLGVSSSFYYDRVAAEKIRKEFSLSNGPVWFVNRRIHPHYHTIELVLAFIEFRKSVNSGYLFVLEGDSDKQYFQNFEEIVKGNDYIFIINGFVNQDLMRAYLSVADFSISVPETDQLSSSILESAACNTIPVMADLKAYESMKDIGITIKILDLNSYNSYKDVFFDSYNLLNSGKWSFFCNKLIKSVSELYIGNSIVERSVCSLYS
jgi:hypothetical protein